MRQETKKQTKDDKQQLRSWQKVLYVIYTGIWTVFPFIVLNHPQWSVVFGYLNDSKTYLVLHFFPVLTLLLILLLPHKAGGKDRIFGLFFFILGVLGYWYNPFTVVIAAVDAALKGVTIPDVAARVLSEAIMVAILFFAVYIMYIGNTWRNEVKEQKEI